MVLIFWEHEVIQLLMWLNLLYQVWMKVVYWMPVHYELCLTSNKQIEMCVSVMNGKDLSSGLVGMIQNIRNPIKSCHLVME